MGWNATVIVMLDSLHEIAADPGFGAKLASAIKGMSLPTTYRNRMVSAGGHCNAAEVIETHHADDTAIVAVGGNFGTKLALVPSREHRTEEGQLSILKQLAEKHGYYIARKPTKKPTVVEECGSAGSQ